MSEIMIARRSGAVIDGDGNRVFIRAGRSVADADHPLVTKYPKAWVPVNVTFRTDGSGTPVAEPDADSFDPLAPVEVTPEDISAAAADVEHANEFRRLAGALRERGALPDRPLTAEEFTDHVLSMTDQAHNLVKALADDQDEVEQQAIDADLDRETVRAWAKSVGMAVADKGRLAGSVYDAYRAAQ